MSSEEKGLGLERMVFFSDAVVAIAITLLALGLKVETNDEHLSFQDILSPWKTFLAFVLSFLNIASFWKTHHSFFNYIKKSDDRLMWYNILWLFFIVTLPFSTTLVSDYISDTPAIFVYSLNVFLISVFQNAIWDYSASHPDYLKDMSDAVNYRMRLFCNLDMVNAFLCVVLSFFSPITAFILLFTKIPMILMAIIYLGVKFKKENEELYRLRKELKRPGKRKGLES